LVRGASAHRVPQHRLVGIKNSELLEQLFSFAKSVHLFQNDVSTNATRDNGNEFDDCLMRNPHGIFLDAATKNLCCYSLFVRKPIVKTIDENVPINERGHGCKGPLDASLDPGHASSAWRWLAPEGVL
jgi:hypothetical protein